MAGTLKVGIAGGGWPGLRHVDGYRGAGGFKITAVADLIPERRDKLAAAAGAGVRAVDDVQALIADRSLDAISICLPTDQHVPVAIAAMKSGKHVIIEPPPAPLVRGAKQLAAAAARYDKVLLYALQRRFGGAEQAARQAMDKGYAGTPYHARAVWTRTRGVPQGTGWYTDPEKSGGGSMIDLGLPLLDLAWSMLGEPTPQSVYCVTHGRLGDLGGSVEEAAIALVRFEGGQSLELVSSWALNQPPSQNGTVCRVLGDAGALEIYTPRGPLLYRGFERGEPKETTLKLPKTTGHAALLRHFRECISGNAQPVTGAATGVMLMNIIEAIYKSAQTGKSADVKVPASESSDA
ncbi:MAG TPA: Gfo/Idh/MocA family oxidoreductase [Tepidisphaeraceae bacterium]|jgi:predicted dehydrogenase|nr:Gfo/Idh/MocA family oxidoreductase [Tepidisphaeraceae bacterium]